MRDKLRKIFGVVVRRVQKVVMWVLLVMLYVFGFGATAAFALVFDRRVYRKDRPGQESYWVDAEEYVPDLDKSRHQS